MSEGRPMKATSVLGESALIIGNLGGKGDIEIRGTVQGDVRISGRVSVARGGSVLGSIEALQIAVSGTVRGDLSAGDTIVIEASGDVEGNLQGPRVAMETGARVRGMVVAGTAGDAVAPRKTEARSPRPPVDAIVGPVASVGSPVKIEKPPQAAILTVPAEPPRDVPKGPPPKVEWEQAESAALDETAPDDEEEPLDEAEPEAAAEGEAPRRRKRRRRKRGGAGAAAASGLADDVPAPGTPVASNRASDVQRAPDSDGPRVPTFQKGTRPLLRGDA
jgi:cytoskeletal protein CcmA (bactofilin family)